MIDLRHGDSRDVIKTLADNSVDSVVTDPPYALVSIVKRFGADGAAPAKGNDVYTRASAGFMGQRWDTGEVAHDPEFWREVRRVLKPGGHLIAFAGTRTYHRLAVAVEDAGFEIRDQILDMVASDTDARAFFESLNDAQRQAFAKMLENGTFGGQLGWLYGSGFPKSHDVSKGIDKALGHERAKVRVDASQVKNPKATGSGRDGMEGATRPWIEAALERGYHEVASPEAASPEAASWQGWGTALKPAWEPIVLARKPLVGTVAANVLEHGTGAINVDGCRVGDDVVGWGGARGGSDAPTQSKGRNYRHSEGVARPVSGRWPANVIHDGSAEVEASFPHSESRRQTVTSQPGKVFGNGAGLPSHTGIYGNDDSGSAARFFYSAKADAEDRFGSHHPTVKPVDLMAYLCRLVTPPGGTVLYPFAGSGTTGIAARREGFAAILIERDEKYVADIRARLDWTPDGAHRAAIVARHKTKAAGDLPLFQEFGGGSTVAGPAPATAPEAPAAGLGSLGPAAGVSFQGMIRKGPAAVAAVADPGPDADAPCGESQGDKAPSPAAGESTGAVPARAAPPAAVGETRSDDDLLEIPAFLRRDPATGRLLGVAG